MKTGEPFDLQMHVEVAGNYDLVVCGGGTAGCVAAIAAGRAGVKTALIESNYFLGGMMTGGNAGLTKFIVHGISADASTSIVEDLRKDDRLPVQPVGGIPMEITNRLLQSGAAVGTHGTAASYVYADSHEFKILLFDLLREAGVDIYLHTSITDIIMDGDAIQAVIAHTKQGPLAFFADYFIDSTGDGDVAFKAGVPYVLGVGKQDSVFQQGRAELGTLQAIGSMFRIGGVDFGRLIKHLKLHPEHFAVQPFGLQTLDEFIKAYEAGEMIIGSIVTPDGKKCQVYNYPHQGVMVGCLSIAGNRNGLDVRTLTDTEYDVMVTARSQVSMLRDSIPGFENAFVLDVPQAGVRETRHFEGAYKLNIEDILTQRAFEDTIGMGCHPVDIYPLPKEMEEIPKQDRFYFHIPYRCLVAKGPENLLLAGRNVSSTREAAGCTRPTVPCMITGEAAGTAVGLCKAGGIRRVEDVDCALLRKQLASQGAVV